MFSILFSTICLGQNLTGKNEFKLGIYGGSACKRHYVNGCEVSYDAPVVAGHKTSILNVLSEDGFNIYQTYEPNEWTSEEFLKSYLKLSKKNNFKVLLSGMNYYQPKVDVINGEYLGMGINVYDNCGNVIEGCQTPYSQNYFRPHFNNFINDIYTIVPYKDIIWGYQLSEESSYYHWQHFSDNCQGNKVGNPNYFRSVEVPLSNVNQALLYYKNSLSSANVTNHKMTILEANHHKNINENTNDGEGIYNPQEYIKLLTKTDNRDVFFESSYTQFSSSAWLNQKYSEMFNDHYHYLGAFKSIDYAKNYVSEIHKVISIEGTSVNSNCLTHYHSNVNIPNANWLWFQAYTSIIHGVKGLWFWDINYAWNEDEINNWKDSSVIDMFDRDYFPGNYRNYVAYLARELRFLINKNIISTDDNTIIATKTDSADVNCIVPDASTYIPSSLPKEKRTENYGLRYTIRSNGEETYMIITNPLNVNISVNLNFANSSNKQIQYSAGVNVLFDDNQYPTTSPHYKVNRNFNVDINSGGTCGYYYKSYSSNKRLNLSFGPLDVKVLQFVSTDFIPNYNNGWNNIWSNLGKGNLGSYIVSDEDLFYIGDFDGDGIDEVLCVGKNKNIGSSNDTDWLTILKYGDNNWETLWSNNGSSAGGNGIYSYRDALIVGDFDGDGADELLGNDVDGWTTLFKFTNRDWQWYWSDYGNSSCIIRQYKDKIYSGDFDGDGKDELLCCDLPNGWTAMFKWNGIDFINVWSDYDENISMRPYRNRMMIGDFDGDNKAELLGLSTWATIFHFDNGNWQWGWSTYGADNFNNWEYPPLETYNILVGNIDSDNKDELFFLDTQPNATWATTMDLKSDQSGWNWNWSANPEYSVPYVDDWSLSSNGGNHTKYYLIKAESSKPNYLLTMRKFCNSYLVSMYQPIDNVNYKKPILKKNSINMSNDDICISPNPSDGKMRIISKRDIKYIEILDMTGKVIYNKEYDALKNIEIDISQYWSGSYVLKVTDFNDVVLINKLIINK